MQEFKLTDIGEGLEEAEIIKYLVKPGDTVALNQPVVELETAKSAVEMPSPYEGIVEKLHFKAGDIAHVGDTLISILESDKKTASPSKGKQAAGAKTESGDPIYPLKPQNDASNALLDSSNIPPYDNKQTAFNGHFSASASSRAQRLKGQKKQSEPLSANNAQLNNASKNEPQEFKNLVGYASLAAAKIRRKRLLNKANISKTPPAIARPQIRKLAKDLSVNIDKIIPTGANGEITRDDVINAANQASVFHNIKTPEQSRIRTETIKVQGIRKSIANAMITSAFTAPHVSVWVDVDVSSTMEYVAYLKKSPSFCDLKISPLLIFAKAVIWAVKRNPKVNSSFDEETISVHHFINLGIAAATPRGLIVPNIKEAQDMSLKELATALNNLVLTAREGKTTPQDLKNGTITITNIGVFGVDAGTPILNPGECSIIALGAIRKKPWVVDGEVKPRDVLTISASFDHRIVDGDIASRFTADVASVMQNPAILLDY